MPGKSPVTWRGVPDAAMPDLRWHQRALFLLRAAAIAALTLVLLVPFLALRLVDHKFGTSNLAALVARPWARALLVLAGITLRRSGAIDASANAIVANHSSWLDILALTATIPGHFVAKSEIRHWHGVGLIAGLSGTEFIRRNGVDSHRQNTRLQSRLNQGHRLCFFPEGTSSDGQRVLPFKSTLFAPLFRLEASRACSVQPVSISYRSPRGQAADFYGLWGDGEFLAHLKSVLALSHGGTVTLILHPALAVGDFTDRKALALRCHAIVQHGFWAAKAG